MNLPYVITTCIELNITQYMGNGMSPDEIKFIISDMTNPLCDEPLLIYYTDKPWTLCLVLNTVDLNVINDIVKLVECNIDFYLAKKKNSVDSAA